MTLTIRIANRVRLTAPVTRDRVPAASRMIAAQLDTLRRQGAVSVTLNDGPVTYVLHRD